MKHILPGSMEVDDGVIIAGVHTGPSEFQPENLRYIQAEIGNGQPGDTIIDLMGRVYDNSTGCMVKGTFKVSE